MNTELLEKRLEKSHKVIDKLVLKLEERERKLFYKHLLNIIDLNIQLEKYEG